MNIRSQIKRFLFKALFWMTFTSIVVLFLAFMEVKSDFENSMELFAFALNLSGLVLVGSLSLRLIDRQAFQESVFG